MGKTIKKLLERDRLFDMRLNQVKASLAKQEEHDCQHPYWERCEKCNTDVSDE